MGDIEGADMELGVVVREGIPPGLAAVMLMPVIPAMPAMAVYIDSWGAVWSMGA